MTFTRRHLLASGAALPLGWHAQRALAQSLDAAIYAPWAVYYRDTLPARAFFDYRLAVFDADKHPPLEPLFPRDILLLGYISFGEIEPYRPGFVEARQAGYVLEENPAWKGSHFVDLRDARWRKRLLEEQAPAIWDKGFHGFFLDTLDNAAHLERLDAKRFSGMVDAASDLVLGLRRRFPKAQIMLNRAFELYPKTSKAVNFLLAESTRARFDTEKKTYIRVPEAEYRETLAKLKAAQKDNPALALMSLDYWDTADTAGIKRIYAEQRQAGYLPYVATPELDRLIPEPA